MLQVFRKAADLWTVGIIGWKQIGDEIKWHMGDRDIKRAFDVLNGSGALFHGKEISDWLLKCAANRLSGSLASHSLCLSSQIVPLFLCVPLNVAVASSACRSFSLHCS